MTVCSEPEPCLRLSGDCPSGKRRSRVADGDRDMIVLECARGSSSLPSCRRACELRLVGRRRRLTLFSTFPRPPPARRDASNSTLLSLCFSVLLSDLSSHASLAMSASASASAAAAIDSVQVPSPFDAHVHLREGAVSQLVTPHVRQGGMDVVYVMVSLFVALCKAFSGLLCELMLIALPIRSFPASPLALPAQPQPAHHLDRAGALVRRSAQRALSQDRVPAFALSPPFHHARRDPPRSLQGRPRCQELPSGGHDRLRGRY